jgi:hypothetical protein
MILQPNVITKRTTPQVLEAWSRAHLRVFSTPISGTLAEALTAWSAFETWFWEAMHDDNLVNKRGTWHGQGTTFKGASEIIDGKEVFLPPGPENIFAAYDPTPDPFTGSKGLVDSAEDALRFIGTASHPELRPNRYQEAWDAAGRGDMEGFVMGLAFPKLPGIAKVPGFFTANPKVYLAGVIRCATKLRPDFDAFERTPIEPFPLPPEAA